MNKEKLIALAKELEGLVKQNNSQSTILNVQIYKYEDYSGTIAIKVSRFLKHDFGYDDFYWEADEKRHKDFVINGVVFQYRYFKAIKKENEKAVR